MHKISWRNKSIALTGGRGTAALAHILGDHSYWRHLEGCLVDERKIRIYDLERGITETIDLKDIISSFSIQFGYLQVQTGSQLHIYLDDHWNTPAIIDLPPNFVTVTRHSKYVCVIDRVLGIFIYTSIDTKLVATIKNSSFVGAVAGGGAGESIELDLAGEILALRNNDTRTTATLYDIFTGKSMGTCSPFAHEIAKIRIDNSSNIPASQRLIAVLDVQGNLFVATVIASCTTSSQTTEVWKKVASNVCDFGWHETHPLLVCLDEQSVNVWFSPAVFFNDLELKDFVQMERGLLTLGKSFSLVNSVGQSVVLAKENGALLYIP